MAFVKFMKSIIHNSPFIIQRYKVSGNSMAPTVREGEYVMAEKISFWFKNPKENDIIVFNNGNSQKLIKRIIRKSQNSFWVEGDNKNYSNDSRHFGEIKLNDILGKVIYAP